MRRELAVEDVLQNFKQHNTMQSQYDTTGHQWFCNITDLNRIVKENELRAGYFKVFHFWNNKPGRVSKKDLKSFFEGSQLKQEFEY